MIRAYINDIIIRIKNAIVGPFEPQQEAEEREFKELITRTEEIDSTLSKILEQLPDPIKLDFPFQIKPAEEMIEERKANRRGTIIPLCSTKFTVARNWKSALKMGHLIASDLPNGDPAKFHTVTIVVEEHI